MSVSSLPTVVTTSRLVFIILLLVNIDLSIFNRYSAAAVDAINDDVSLTSTHSIPVADDDDGVVSTIGCGTTKGCLHYPEGCHSPGDCLSVLTWRTAEPGYVDFEMMAPTDGWVAVAFSTDTHMVSETACCRLLIAFTLTDGFKRHRERFVFLHTDVLALNGGKRECCQRDRCAKVIGTRAPSFHNSPPRARHDGNRFVVVE
jgi:hypothetical protein